MRACNFPVALALAFLLVPSIPAAAVSAQSLWNADAASLPVFSDTTARTVGDILTIMVDENQQVENEEESKHEKSSSLAALISNFDLLPNLFEPLPRVEASSDKDFEGKATYDKDNRFRTTLSVVVIDVMPNRNLLVEGTRRLIVDGEEKLVRVTGQVRPYDVSADNTVRSSRVANAAIAYEGTGPLTRTTNRGWFSRLLDIVWPF